MTARGSSAITPSASGIRHKGADSALADRSGMLTCGFAVAQRLRTGSGVHLVGAVIVAGGPGRRGRARGWPGRSR
jgi:hypothetical protein